MFYTYGYNGSGVAMRVPVTVIAEFDDGTSWVRFTTAPPPVDALTETVVTDNSRRVRTSSLTTNRTPHLASFNFLD